MSTVATVYILYIIIYVYIIHVPGTMYTCVSLLLYNSTVVPQARGWYSTRVHNKFDSIYLNWYIDGTCINNTPSHGSPSKLK